MTSYIYDTDEVTLTNFVAHFRCLGADFSTHKALQSRPDRRLNCKLNWAQSMAQSLGPRAETGESMARVRSTAGSSVVVRLL